MLFFHAPPMNWDRFAIALNLLALLLNVLSVVLAGRTMAGFYLSLGVNALAVPFDGARLGWCLLSQTSSPRPPGWLLAALAVAALVFACKLAADAVVVLLWLQWKDVPAGGPGQTRS